MTEVCPYCGVEAETTADEVAHMNTEHPGIVRERLRKAGMIDPYLDEVEGSGHFDALDDR